MSGYDDEPLDVSDFEQSDEQASKYEEEQEVRKLLATSREKFGWWWENHKTLRIRAIRIAIFLYVIFAVVFNLLGTLSETHSIVLILFFTAAHTALWIAGTVLVLGVLAGIVWFFLWIFKPVASVNSDK